MFNGYETEEEYLDSLKIEDSYHFSIPIEYKIESDGDDESNWGTTNMEIDVTWSDVNHGYEINHYVPEEYLLDQSKGNGSEMEYFEQIVEFDVRDRLESLGIGPEAICC